MRETLRDGLRRGVILSTLWVAYVSGMTMADTYFPQIWS